MLALKIQHRLITSCVCNSVCATAVSFVAQRLLQRLDLRTQSSPECGIHHAALRKLTSLLILLDCCLGAASKDSICAIRIDTEHSKRILQVLYTFAPRFPLKRQRIQRIPLNGSEQQLFRGGSHLTIRRKPILLLIRTNLFNQIGIRIPFLCGSRISLFTKCALNPPNFFFAVLKQCTVNSSIVRETIALPVLPNRLCRCTAIDTVHSTGITAKHKKSIL